MTYRKAIYLLTLLAFTLTACGQTRPLKAIHTINQFDTLTLDKDLNLEWIKLDKENFNNILILLDNPQKLKNKDQFLKSIIKLDIRETKDLGFGLTYFECAQYGGYVTTWISLLSFENEIIQYDIRYSEIDFKIIDYLIKQDMKLKSEISIVVDTLEPYSFYYQNQPAFDKFKTIVASKLGPIKLSPKDSSKEFILNYSVLTNPIKYYDFGTYCYEPGVEPDGRKAINFFTSANNIDAIKEIIKGYNPEGRLYAIQAFLTYVKESKAVLRSEDRTLIKNVLGLNIPISACRGCIVSEAKADDLLDTKLKDILKE